LLRRVAPRGRRWHAWPAGSWPGLGRWHSVLALRRFRLPGGHLPGQRRPVGVLRGLDRPSPVWRRVGGGSSLADGLGLVDAAEQPNAVDGVEGWAFGRAPGLIPLSLLQERHAPTTI